MTKRRGVSHLCFELGSLRRRFGFLCRHRRVRRRFGGELLPETIDPLGAPRNFRGNLRFLRLQRGAKNGVKFGRLSHRRERFGPRRGVAAHRRHGGRQRRPLETAPRRVCFRRGEGCPNGRGQRRGGSLGLLGFVALQQPEPPARKGALIRWVLPRHEPVWCTRVYGNKNGLCGCGQLTVAALRTLSLLFMHVLRGVHQTHPVKACS